MKNMLHAVAFGAMMGLAGLLGYVTYQTLAPEKSAGSRSVDSSIRPDFRMPDLEGTMRSASDWDGQWLLLNFWASWCTPCVEEMPLLMQLRDDYAKQNFNVVGIAVDDPAAAQEFAKKMQLDFPNLVASNDGTRLARAYGNALGGLPFTVLINPQRKIVWRWSGQLEDQPTRELLNQHL